MAYENTDVTVSKSQQQIRDLLLKHGATRTNFAEDYAAGHESIGVEFVFTDTLVRMVALLAMPSDEVERERARAVRRKAETEPRAKMDREARRMWRVIHWAVKSRMEAIEEGLETFEQAFLPHIVDPASGATLWEAVRAGIESGALKLGGSGLRALTAGAV